MLDFGGKKCICGTVKIGERGQVVIPKQARDYFAFEAGDSLIAVADKENQTITLMKANSLKDFAEKIMILEEDNE